MSIADNLRLINTYKGDIKEAIENKGVDMTDIPLSGYASKIGEITGGGTGNLQEKDVVVDKNGIVDMTEYVTIRYYEFAAGSGRWMCIDARAGRKTKVVVGQTIDVIEGQNVNAGNSTSLSRPLMTFIGWDSPIDIIDGKITIPNDWIGDVDIYANYIFDDNYYVNHGSSTLNTGTYTGSELTTVFRKNWDGMVTNGSNTWIVSRTRNPIILSGDFVNDGNNYFFSSFPDFIDLVLPMSIGQIGNDTTTTSGTGWFSTFYYATGMRNCHLPNNLEKIGNKAFYHCDNLETINFPSHLKIIGFNAFYTCGVLNNIILPSTIERIDNTAFRNCYYLNVMHIKATTPPVLGTNVFQGGPYANGAGKIYVPDSAVMTYKTNQYWSQYADLIYPESEYNK